MKKLVMVLALLLLPAIVFAQSSASQIPTATPGLLYKTYTNYTIGSGDTTNYLTLANIPGWTTSPLFCSEVMLLGVATDSVAAAVTVFGRNSIKTGFTVNYSDSLVGTSNTSNTRIIVLKDATLDRLAGCDQFKVGVAFATAGHASANGTTTGRTCKWYLLYKFP